MVPCARSYSQGRVVQRPVTTVRNGADVSVSIGRVVALKALTHATAGDAQASVGADSGGEGSAGTGDTECGIEEIRSVV